MSSTNRGGKRSDADFYATPAWCVHRLLDRLWLPRTVWLEPAAGDGAIVRAADSHVPSEGRAINWLMNELREECEDGLEQLCGEVEIGDFLEHSTSYEDQHIDVVITNPPFSVALEFIQAALPIAPWVVMLLRLNFMGSEERSSFLRDEQPDVYVLPNRPSFTGKGTDSIEYAWFVWTPERGRSAGKIELLNETPLAARKAR